MPTTRTKRMCIACHWRKFLRSPIGLHRVEAADEKPVVCGTCKASVFYLYPCNCKKAEVMKPTPRKRARAKR